MFYKCACYLEVGDLVFEMGFVSKISRYYNNVFVWFGKERKTYRSDENILIVPPDEIIMP